MKGAAHRLLAVSNDDVPATKLLACSEQRLSFRGVFKPARALREQIDWENVRSRSPFERASSTLVEELGMVENVRSAAA
ncbi:MAG: hypothetical protein M3546_05230 [Actinomycetota bacterium]|nr:hypothetical protein [Actinomycetota bacterium]